MLVHYLPDMVFSVFMYMLGMHLTRDGEHLSMCSGKILGNFALGGIDGAFFRVVKKKNINEYSTASHIVSTSIDMR